MLAARTLEAALVASRRPSFMALARRPAVAARFVRVFAGRRDGRGDGAGGLAVLRVMAVLAPVTPLAVSMAVIALLLARRMLARGLLPGLAVPLRAALRTRPALGTPDLDGRGSGRRGFDGRR
ncbi:MAG: hypothetical protein KGQ28_11580, partial [Hyphomicrobiales bacterium]|nr:hypothetical protein [Hyphomicrobiales bacterium]